MEDNALATFVESVCGESHLRIEQDFGGGFVRLRSSEAEKRQAAQDIRSTEDIVIELLRNARDAGARHIFVALQRDESKRTLVVIDDGDGIPETMQQRIFEPRVTSKLDTAHMDKWGMHGRGMALYSVSVNAEEARVLCSQVGGGTALLVSTDLEKLGEKTDQSTFPRFEVKDGVHVMRGPRNIMRTTAEFALEHRDLCTVYCGSFTEVAATLYAFGMATTTPSMRAFGAREEGLSLPKRLALASTPESFARRAASLGLEMSSRSARRVLDGEIKPLPSLLERLQNESFPEVKRATKAKNADRADSRIGDVSAPRDARGLRLTDEDLGALKHSAEQAYAELAPRYFLDENVSAQVRVSVDAIHITIPVSKLR